MQQSGTERAELCPRWYALRVRSNREKAVRGALEAKGIRAYLPTYTTETNWSDRSKQIERALIPGYVFAHMDLSSTLPALQTAGVVNLLGGNLTPTAIPDAEIDTVRRVADSKLHPEPCAYVVGEPIRIETGALAGLAGHVVRTKGATRVVVCVTFLFRAVSVEVDAETIKKLQPDGAGTHAVLSA